MKKICGSKLCYLLSGILSLGFILKVLNDYVRYVTTLNSAPFYIWIAVDAVYFVLPAIAFAILGGVMKKKEKR